MNDNVESNQLAIPLQLGTENWIFNVLKHDVSETRFSIDACTPNNDSIQFSITTTPTGKWVLSTEELPDIIKDNLQEIGNAIMADSRIEE